MYYIVTKIYEGPNQLQEQFIDANTIEIRTAPAIANSSQEEKIHGWCGTTNDWAVYAHGEFETIEAARAAIIDKFKEVRNIQSDDEDVIEVYKFGK